MGQGMAWVEVIDTNNKYEQKDWTGTQGWQHHNISRLFFFFFKSIISVKDIGDYVSA